MNVPDLIALSSPEEYKKYYVEKYCKKDLVTFEGIKVKFYEDRFAHAFYESSDKSKGNKDIFSIERAKRIDWIEYALKNPKAELYVGWDKKRKKYDNSRRVALITPENYVVIIKIIGKNKGKFVTAYYADNSAKKIRTAPIWNE